MSAHQFRITAIAHDHTVVGRRGEAPLAPPYFTVASSVSLFWRNFFCFNRVHVFVERLFVSPERLGTGTLITVRVW